MISLTQCSVRFSTKVGADRVALHEVSLKIQPGSVVALVGENGSGKTTLLRVLAGELSPDEGRLEAPPLVRRAFMNQDVNANIFQGLTLQEHVLLASGRSGLPPGAARATAEALIRDLCPTLAGRLKEYPETFSGGEKQLLATGIALLGHPHLLLLDEHTASLDQSNGALVWSLVHRYCEAVDAVTVIFSTHDLSEALEHAKRLLVMSKGSIVTDSSADAVDVADLKQLVHRVTATDRRLVCQP